MDNAQVEDVAMNWSSNLKIRGLQGKCVLDKNIRNCRKKLSTIRENKMRLDSI